MSTAARLERSGWWPTRTVKSRDDLVGDAQCAACHSQKISSQQSTPMAQAARLASDSSILRDNPSMSASRGAYRYAIARASDGTTTYSVGDRSADLHATLVWAFGLGNKGQTYIYKVDATYYESELSFYSQIRSLDITTGHETKRPHTLADALGTPLDPPSASKCFACHTTGATTIEQGFQPNRAILGVTCEACHGPGGAHVALMQQTQMEAASDSDLLIFNPRKLDPVAAVDFCGACHRTLSDVYDMNVKGPVSARFQPYRLENSKCWGDGDARLICAACHDPHEPLQHSASAYDDKCVACHSVAGSRIASSSPTHLRNCPVGKSNCVTCHMPKVNVAVMHTTFTDHRIRIVRKGASYPE